MHVDVSDGAVPRFKVGDQIILVGPGFHNGQHGEVVAVIEPSFDHTYRYYVCFSDERSAKFFAFDLQLVRTTSPKAAA